MLSALQRLVPRSTRWLRTTCGAPAPVSATSRGELDQIQFLLGHVSIQTTERYLGCKQKLRIAVNDRLGIEPDAAWPGPPAGADPSIRPARLGEAHNAWDPEKLVVPHQYRIRAK